MIRKKIQILSRRYKFIGSWATTFETKKKIWKTAPNQNINRPARISDQMKNSSVGSSLQISPNHCPLLDDQSSSIPLF